MTTKILFSIVLMALTPSAFAHYTVFESGDLLDEGQMQAAAEIQLKTSGDDGVNLIGRFDTGFDTDSNLRFVVGTGVTDYQLGAFYKWVPFPDYDKQPAVGFTMGAHLSRFSPENKSGSEHELALRFIPFVSKKFDTDKGLFIPFASLPVAFSNHNDDSHTPLQLVLGSRYSHPDFEYCDFSAELGFDLNDSFTYVSFGAIFPTF